MQRIDFDHIALVTHRIADATDFLVGELGGRSGRGGPAGAFRWWHWNYEGGGRIEVLEPDGPADGFVHRFLERRGPGLHHVTFKVPDLDGICERATALGYGIVGYDASDPGWKEAFLHPKEAMGIVVQFAEVGPGDEEREPPSGDPPPEPTSPPTAVSVVGLRMVARDADRARRQWGELLGGELEEKEEEELVFRWPGSAMRIAVTPEPDGEDRAAAVEVRSRRHLTLSAAEHPRLGAQFVQLDAV